MTALMCLQCGTTCDSSPGVAAICPSCWSRGSLIPSVIKEVNRGWVRDVMDVQTADELVRQSYPVVKMSDQYRKIIGDLGDHSSVMLTGEQFTGKSSFATVAAHDIAKRNDWTAVYNSVEEGLGRSVGERLNRLEVRGGRFIVCCKTNLAGLLEVVQERGANVLVIDSYSASSRAEVDALATFHQSAGVLLFVIVHANRSGSYAGNSAIAHYCDTMIRFYREGDAVKYERSKSRFSDVGAGVVEP